MESLVYQYHIIDTSNLLVLRVRMCFENKYKFYIDLGPNEFFHLFTFNLEEVVAGFIEFRKPSNQPRVTFEFFLPRIINLASMGW